MLRNSVRLRALNLLAAGAIIGCGGLAETATLHAASGGGAAGTGESSLGGTHGGGSTQTAGATTTLDYQIAPSCTELGDISEACEIVEIRAAYYSINVLVLLDRSASMATLTEQGGSQWQATVDTLLGVVNPNDTLIRYGLTLFPPKDTLGTIPEGDLSCSSYSPETLALDVPMAAAADSFTDFAALTSSTSPSGASPIADALAFASDYFTSGAGASLNGKKFVLLATDGRSNCNPSLSCSLCEDTARTLERLNQLAADGVETFVLGAADSAEAVATLNALAIAGAIPFAGGERSYFSAASELSGAMTAMTTSLVRDCEFPLDVSTIDPYRTHVFVNCVEIPEGSEGWTYDTTDGVKLMIEGATCEEISTKGVENVTYVRSCIGDPIN